jgi:1-acyl-sn-glycerol-3-phosphate acyltransferase
MLFLAKIFQSLCYWPVFCLLRWLVDYRVEGQKNLRGLENEPIIFVSNHASWLDGLLTAATLPKSFYPVRFLAAERFFGWKYLIVSLGLRINAAVSVAKTGGDYQKSLGAAIEALAGGAKLWMFPEGGLTRNGRLRPGKRGITYLHQKSGARIVPIGIAGSFGLLSLGHILRSGAKVTVHIGKPFYLPKDCSLNDGAKIVMGAIARQLRGGSEGKILAIHGFWRRGIFWNKASEVFSRHGYNIITPDIQWGGDYLEQILRIVRRENPDVIIGMSLGGYAVQQIFERLEREEAQCCVLIAPVGPHGLGLHTFLKMIIKGKQDKEEDSERVDERISDAWHALPFCGSVWQPIHAPTLVISGGRDNFVSRDDAERIANFHHAGHKHWAELNHGGLAKDEEVLEYIALWIFQMIEQ